MCTHDRCGRGRCSVGSRWVGHVWIVAAAVIRVSVFWFDDWITSWMIVLLTLILSWTHSNDIPVHIKLWRIDFNNINRTPNDIADTVTKHLKAQDNDHWFLLHKVFHAVSDGDDSEFLYFS